MVQFSEKAVAKIKELKKKHPEWANLPFRLYLCQKGCDGFVYGAIFDPLQRKDQVIAFDGFDCVLSINAYRVLSEAFVDYLDDGPQSGFLISNPNHAKYRGKFWVKHQKVAQTLE